MKPIVLSVFLFAVAVRLYGAGSGPGGRPLPAEGPAAALAFARNYRGETYKPSEALCYPDAQGIPFADCEHVIPMTDHLWTPRQIVADFQRRMANLPTAERKKGIILVLKTERCAPKPFRGCSVTTAALERRSTPLAGEFLIYGVQLKPRDKDNPAGSLKIETGLDAWKNDAAREYDFKQGPGASLVFVNPVDGAVLEHTDAQRLKLNEKDFTRDAGRTPTLHSKLEAVLKQLAASRSPSPS